MTLALLIDFGSTYTKVVAVDLEAGQVVGQAQAVTTVENDITEGLQEALSRLQEGCGLRLSDFAVRLACSSAKGGLRVVAIGLVPELTTEAAKRAALGAGARILRVFSHKLTLRDLKDLDDLAPDLILLAGGTDGGNDRVILHNARLLASMRLACPIVVAGNRDAADEVEETLRSRGKDVTVTENVLPHLGVLNVEPARTCIREVFMRTITRAKGLDKVESLVGGVVMPTPMAVLRAARLLAEGTKGERGLGELMVLDVGGATTDVHSVARGEPTDPMVLQRGLPEPYAKRTVEGDLGLRVSALALLEAVGEEALREAIGVEGLDVRAAVQRRAQNPGYVSDSPEEEAVD
ncbi:MAG: methylaspartate mutase accessory protein GlmL, partial [Anaerolineae bacterium]